MAVAVVAIHQLSPSIEGDLKGVLSLPLKCLQAEASLQHHLIRLEVRVDHHPGQQGHQISGITTGAAQADQQSVLVGLTAQPGTATLHQIRQGEMVEGTTAPAHHRSQQLVRSSLTGWVLAASPWEPELGCHHIRGAQWFQQQRWCRHSCLLPGRAIRVQAFSG